MTKNRNNSVKQPAHEAVGAPSPRGGAAPVSTVFNPCRIFVMTKRFLAAAAFVLLSSTVSASATDIGATFETTCPFGDCAAGISLSYLGEFV
ncbi:esterase-like activity of phytase family protein, partial [Rhizobium ruizarguesonis]